jgi:hypothetical protein
VNLGFKECQEIGVIQERKVNLGRLGGKASLGRKEIKETLEL